MTADEPNHDRNVDKPDRALIARHEQRVEASRRAALAAGVDAPPAKTVAAADGWLARALELRSKKGKGAKRTTAIDDRHEFESPPRPRLAAQQPPAGGLAALFPPEPGCGSGVDEDDLLAFLDALPPDPLAPEAPGAAEADLRELLELYVESVSSSDEEPA